MINITEKKFKNVEVLGDIMTSGNESALSYDEMLKIKENHPEFFNIACNEHGAYPIKHTLERHYDIIGKDEEFMFRHTRQRYVLDDKGELIEESLSYNDFRFGYIDNEFFYYQNKKYYEYNYSNECSINYIVTFINDYLDSFDRLMILDKVLEHIPWTKLLLEYNILPYTDLNKLHADKIFNFKKGLSYYYNGMSYPLAKKVYEKFHGEIDIKKLDYRKCVMVDINSKSVECAAVGVDYGNVAVDAGIYNPAIEDLYENVFTQKCLSNVESFQMKWFEPEYGTYLNQLYDMALKLNKKISCKWSLNRIKDMIQQWGYELVMIECIKGNKVFNYPKIYQLINEHTPLELLTDLVSLKLEGIRQKHCVGGKQDYVNCGYGFFKWNDYTIQIGISKELHADKMSYHPTLEMVKGRCNSDPSDETMKLLNSMLTMFFINVLVPNGWHNNVEIFGPLVSYDSKGVDVGFDIEYFDNAGPMVIANPVREFHNTHRESMITNAEQYVDEIYEKSQSIGSKLRPLLEVLKSYKVSNGVVKLSLEEIEKHSNNVKNLICLYIGELLSNDDLNVFGFTFEHMDMFKLAIDGMKVLDDNSIGEIMIEIEGNLTALL